MTGPWEQGRRGGEFRDGLSLLPGGKAGRKAKLGLAVTLSLAGRDWNLERSRQLIFKGTVTKRNELYKRKGSGER